MEKDEIRELIICSKQGDTKAFGKLVVLFQTLVFQLSFRLLCDNDEAKDMVQEVFIKLWLHLEKYDPQYKFSTWVYKITCNMCYDRLRSVQHYPQSTEISPFIAEYVAVSPQNIEMSVINKELKELILYFTNGLSPKQKLVFTLNDVEGLNTEEIKEITGLSAGQIKSNLHLARKFIKDKINTITS
jgi:RNA polymerase sigma-70 factor (ECF subfamily)